MLSVNFYHQHLKKINNVCFTPREIDIIAFIINGRTAKKIASTLHLSPKTVENYTRNIMLKVGCNSQEGIRDFIEKSGKFLLFRNLYGCILQKIAFEEWVKNNKHLIENYKHVCLIIYKNNPKNISFIDDIEKLLNFSGFKTLKSEESVWNSFHSLFDVPNHIDCAIYCLSSELMNKMSADKINIFDDILDHIKKFKIIPNCILSFDPESKIDFNVLTDLGDLERSSHIKFDERENYYQQFFMILKNIMPQLDLDKIISDFEKKSTTPSLINISTQVTVPAITYPKYSFNLSEFLNKVKNKIIYIGFIFILFLFVILFKENTERNNANELIIRSDLLIPNENFFLKRSNIIKQMEENLKDKNSIQAIVLTGVTGIGGAGKTTLARYYGKQSKTSIVWEINSENKEALLSSFKNLAYKLSNTKEKKDELAYIQQIQNADEKEKLLLFFIQNQLKEQKDWLLIYDNVNSVSDIKQFFPRDVNVWGKGKVIVTTKNDNILNSPYVGDLKIVKIDQLTPDESLYLFCKILYNKEYLYLPQEELNKIRIFLKKIPSFPLDISITAHYIKNASLSFDQYIERMTKYGSTLEKEQQRLLEETTDYTKTRYMIIASAFSKLLEINPAYKDLLLLICLMDSQNIPSVFLSFYRDPILVDHFISDLKRYSLIISQIEHSSPSNKNGVFSLHRSTQTLGRTFLLTLLNHKEKDFFIMLYAKTIKNYYVNYIEKKHQLLESMMPHLETLLRNANEGHVLNKNSEYLKQDILFILGFSYMKCFGDFSRAKNYLIKADQLQQKTNHFSDLENALLLKKISELCMHVGENANSIMYAKRSLNICSRLSHAEILTAKNFRIMSFVYAHQNEFDQANMSLQKALTVVQPLQTHKKDEIESNIYALLGYLYSTTDINRDLAYEGLRYSLRTLTMMNADQFYFKNKVQKEKEISCKIMQYKSNVGEVYCRLGLYDEALEYFKDAQFIVDYPLDNCSHRITKVLTTTGLGEVYLRKNQLKLAEEKLVDSIKESEKILGSHNRLMLLPRMLCAEVKFRLKKLDEAYEQYLFALKIENKTQTNYSRLIYLMGHYNAGVIQHKQGNIKKSMEHFSTFLVESQKFGKSFLSDKDYKQLENQKTFINDSNEELDSKKIIKQFLKQSEEIFTMIYGENHPFVCDYVRINNV